MALVRVRLRSWLWLMLLCLTFSLLLLLQIPGHTILVKEVPNPQKVDSTWITDMANVLSDDTEVMLNQSIAELKNARGSEIIIVTVYNTTPSSSPEDFTRELFNSWNSNPSNLKNSVLLVIAKEENYAAIKVGTWIRRIVPKTKADQVLTTHIVPNLKNNNLEEGIIASTEDLITLINPPFWQWPIARALLLMPLGGCYRCKERKQTATIIPSLQGKRQ